jgi:hypothetical protein
MWSVLLHQWIHSETLFVSDLHVTHLDHMVDWDHMVDLERYLWVKEIWIPSVEEEEEE